MTELEAKAKDCIENHTHKLVDKPTKQDIYLREESIFISGYRLGATEATKELQEELEKAEEKINILDNCDRLGDVITDAYKHKLTKAKEIIKKLMVFAEADLREYEEEYKEAEQFLKEE